MAAPTYVSVSPATVYKRDLNKRLTITGTNFITGIAVTFSDTNIEVLQTVLYSSTVCYVDINVPDTCTAAAGNLTITTSGGAVTGIGVITVATQLTPMDRRKVEKMADGEVVPFVDSEGKAVQPQLDSAGRIKVAADLSVEDIEIGAVELKDATSDTRVAVKTDGVNNALVVMENGKATGAYNQVGISNTATLVRAAVLGRRMISIHNTSANNCYVGTDASVTISNGHLLPGHCSLDFGGYTGAIYAVFVAAGPTTVTYIEV